MSTFEVKVERITKPVVDHPNNAGHIREGVVIRGEGNHPKYGRKIAKAISPNYFLRKNATEFN